MSTTRPAPAVSAAPPRAKKKRAGTTFIIAGVALGIVAFVGVFFYTSTAGGVVAGDVPVVVAAHDLAIRVPIRPADLTVAKFHSDDVPTGSFTKVADVPSVVAAATILKGQAVTSNLVIAATDTVIGPQSAYLPIPQGYVALTIPTGEQIGVAGYIQVGDYISLVATVTGKTSTNVRTVFTNIRVIRIGAAPSETQPVQGSTTTPPKTGGLTTSLTVIVTQCQAEFITWFLGNGGLRYTLESYHDYQTEAPTVDPTCKNVSAATGVSSAQVSAKWPGIMT